MTLYCVVRLCNTLRLLCIALYFGYSVLLGTLCIQYDTYWCALVLLGTP